MGKRPKLEMQLNQPTKITLVFDDCVEGINPYGKPYALYVLEHNGTEFAHFASEETHQHLKHMEKGQSIIVTKRAKQSGNRVVFSYEFTDPDAKPKPKVKYHKEPVPISEVIPQILPDIPEIDETEDNITTNIELTEEFNSLYNHMRQSLLAATKLENEFNELQKERIAISLFIQSCRG